MIRLFIKKLIYGGYGLSAHNGKTCFVRYAAPQETVYASILKEKKDFFEGIVEEVEEPSKARRKAPCKYYGRCGGCQLQHIDYNEQVSAKSYMLEETLKRIGGLTDLSVCQVIPSKDEFFYRTRVQFKVQDERLGFLSWDDREVVEIDECLIAHPQINALIEPLKKILPFIDGLQEIHVFYSPTEDEYLIKFVTKTHLSKSLLKKIINDFLPSNVVGVGNYKKVIKSLNKRHFIGRAYTFIDVENCRFRVGADSFFQVNYRLWEDLSGVVLEEITDFKKAVELHCGVGFFTLPLSKKGGQVEASDSNPFAVEDADCNKKLNGRDNVSFIASAASKHLITKVQRNVDLVLLDPPRGGLMKRERELLAAKLPESIVYISCNPSTLARDLKFLSKKYLVEKIKLIDLFPQSYHIESVAILRRI